MAEAPRRLLVVSADLGEGRDATVRALAEAAARLWPGIAVDRVDVLDAMGRGTAWACRRLYAVFHSSLPCTGAASRVVGGWGGRALAPDLDRCAPDLVVSTSPTASTALAWLRAHRGLDTPCATWISGLASHPSWTHEGVDASLVALADAAASRDTARTLPASDALFLHAETPEAPQYVGTVLVFEDGPPLTAEHAAGMLAAVAGITGRLEHARPLRRARWRADGHNPHALVERVTAADLPRAVDDFFSEPLPADGTPGAGRLVDGLPDGRRALLVKLHHALGDGMTVLQALLSDTDTANGLSWARRPSVPLTGTRFRPELRTLARGVWRLAAAGRRPVTPLDGALADSARHHVLVRLPGRQVRRAARTLDVTPAELVTTLFAQALHDALGAGAPPRLRLMVPWSLRGTASLHDAGNHTGAVSVDLPTGPMPVGARARRVAAALRGPADEGVPEAAHTVVRLTGLLPPPLQRAAARAMYRGGWFTAIGTVMPGPRREIRWHGSRLSEAYPVLALAPGTRLAWGAMTWGPWVLLGCTTTPALASTVDVLGVRARTVLAELAGDPEEQLREAR